MGLVARVTHNLPFATKT